MVGGIARTCSAVSLYVVSLVVFRVCIVCSVQSSILIGGIYIYICSFILHALQLIISSLAIFTTGSIYAGSWPEESCKTHKYKNHLFMIPSFLYMLCVWNLQGECVNQCNRSSLLCYYNNQDCVHLYLLISIVAALVFIYRSIASLGQKCSGCSAYLCSPQQYPPFFDVSYYLAPSWKPFCQPWVYMDCNKHM